MDDFISLILGLVLGFLLCLSTVVVPIINTKDDLDINLQMCLDGFEFSEFSDCSLVDDVYYCTNDRS